MIDYCNAVLNGTPSHSIKKLQQVQNNAVRTFLDAPRRAQDAQRQPVVEDVTLAARSAEDRLQSGSADVQSPQRIYAVVPPSPNPGATTQPQPAIGHYDAVSTFHIDAKRAYRCSAPAVWNSLPKTVVNLATWCLRSRLLFRYGCR